MQSEFCSRADPRASTRPTKIAILGGGMAALTTAFELTRDVDWRSRYEITIYQQGHRLGGKCASARARQGSGPGTIERIEEHGLHMFFGFYENAFALMRECYEALNGIPCAEGESRRLGWDEAFLPHELIMFGHEHEGGSRSWAIPFPRRRGQPGIASNGDPQRAISLIDGASVLSGLFELLVSTLLRAADLSHDGMGARVAGEGELERLFDGIRETSDTEDLVAALARAARIAANRLPRNFDPESSVRTLRALESLILKIGATRIARTPIVRTALAAGLSLLRSALLASVARSELEPFARHQLRASIDFFFTVGIGLLRDNMLRAGVDWFAFDQLDYRDWLRKHGASEEMVQSAPLRALGDAVFADAVTSGWGAGTTLHLMLRMLLTYKQSILFRFGAGTGEVLVAPLYRVLVARGVQIKFFHRIEQLVPETSGPVAKVRQIKFRRQATVTAGSDAYAPLAPFQGTLCWPLEPDYDQLAEGAVLRAGGHDLENSWNSWDPLRPLETLELGMHFDLVVLGIGLGALPGICSELARVSESLPPTLRAPGATAPRFHEMLRHVRTVETLGVQLWLKPPLSQLGGPSDRGVGIAYPQPLDTWAEMNHLLSHERWPAGQEPGTLLYLCSNLEEPAGYEPPPFDDHGHPRRQRERVAQIAKTWLDHHGSRIFPGARAKGRFNYDLLVDPHERSGDARFQAQLHCATLNPSDRYVLSAPNTSRFRLRPHESGFHNLVLAGDWTLNAISAGCVEGAVISGRDAARALIGRPTHIVGDWLTEVRPELLSKPLLAESTETAAPAQAFVRLPFDLLTFPPYVCKRAQSEWFFFRARPETLSSLCDRYLNQPGSPTHYAPLAPLVAFVATRIEACYPERERLGFLPEKDFGFWVPVRASALPGCARDNVASPIAWFQPCLWVDSGPAVSGGREVLGLNKSLGRLQWPTQRDPAFAVDTLALVRQGRADDGRAEPVLECTVQRILELQRQTDGPLSERLAGLSDLGTFLMRGLTSLAGSAVEGLEPLLKQLAEGTVPLVALKQFPDCSDSSRACYKAVVETPTRATHYRKFRAGAARHELRLFDLASHPLAEGLGLFTEPTPAGARHAACCRSFLALELDFDFVVESGRVVFDVLKGSSQHDQLPMANAALRR